MDEVKSPAPRRSYGQFCALARTLDLVGDRWSLLIVRELLPGPLRYGELKNSLAGIATNLLSDRLKSLESDGVVERRVAERGIVYDLTPWGTELREALEALGRWGTPLLASGRGDDAFHPRWLVLALPALLRGVTSDPSASVVLDVEGYSIALHVDQTGPHASADLGQPLSTTFHASADTVVALAAGAISVEEAIHAGHLDGEQADLRRVFGRSSA